MHTISMQGIADLARVRRPVVSAWRDRYDVHAEYPFPTPLATEPLRFATAEVASWLSATGRGTNPDASLESVLHSDAMLQLLEHPGRASALLLLHQLLGEPVSTIDREVAVSLASELELGAALGPDAIDSALADRQLCSTVDEVVEAAFAPSRVCERLVASFTSRHGTWAAEALTERGNALLGSILAEVLRSTPFTLVPAGPGGLVLLSAATRGLGEHERPAIDTSYTSTQNASDLVAQRFLAIQGFELDASRSRTSSGEHRPGRLVLFQAQAARLADYREQLAAHLSKLRPGDALVVVGAAADLTDPPGQRDRARLLAPAKDQTAPLRYVARLPKGFSRFGGRRRLAMWVFSGEAAAWAVAGTHGDAPDDAGTRSAIAADVVAALGSPESLRAHAFLASTIYRAAPLVREAELVGAAPSLTQPAPGGERLAKVWALRDALADAPTVTEPLGDLELSAAEHARPTTMRLARALELHLIRDLRGARIPSEHLGAPRAGWAEVIGAEEVREPSSIGRRGIDRLDLEAVAPRATLTEAGDVIYLATGGPGAIVDDRGGRVVLAPARILRCKIGVRGDHLLLPRVVAADVAAQRGADRRNWLLRAVPRAQTAFVTGITDRAADLRRQLLNRVSTLDALERELVSSLADGSLLAAPPARTSSPAAKAEA